MAAESNTRVAFESPTAQALALAQVIVSGLLKASSRQAPWKPTLPSLEDRVDTGGQCQCEPGGRGGLGALEPQWEGDCK